MLQCSFSLAAAQLLVQMTSALQKSQCCSAGSAAQHSKNCSATSVFACGMLQGRGLEGWGFKTLGLAKIWALRDFLEEDDLNSERGGFCESPLVLSGPLNRLNAILSLLQPLDRYRTPSAIGSAIGRPYLALSRIHAQLWESSTASF